MSNFANLTQDELKTLQAEFSHALDEKKSQGLTLDLTRGKPCSEQCDLSNGLITILNEGDFKSDGGVDCRNYGGLDGLPEAKAIFSEILEVPANQVVISGNASLQVMNDVVCRAMTHGVPSSAGPWIKEEKIKFICPAPGYDRHFTICSHFGIEMITVENTSTGPDMDAVEALVKTDPSIKGIWIVPKYGNPTGETCSEETVNRLAKMETAAGDFRIFWDNAYAVHHLTDTPDPLANIYTACEVAGNADRLFAFASFSKVTFAGSSISAFGASPANIEWINQHLFVQTIGPDKMNQLRHIRFFKNYEGVVAHMKKHAEILKPKFDAVAEILEKGLSGKGIATWTTPRGGYFISVDVMDNCAKAVVAKANEAGVKLTSAGATFPNGEDPRDRNIRLAPTFPSAEEALVATEIFVLCIQLVSIEKLLTA